MSREMGKGGREGKQRRKFEAKKHAKQGSGEGADGLEAWSKNTAADFQADQALLLTYQQKLQAASAEPAEAAASAASAAPAAAESPAAAASSSSSAAPAAASSSSSSSVSLFTPGALNIVDGALLEGGGQVLRNAMAYAALLGLPIKIKSIRAGRMSGGGLKRQHQSGLQLVHDMVGGKLNGAELHSREAEFFPGHGAFEQLRNPKIEFLDPTKPILCFDCDIQTAGATGLLIQISLPVCLFLPYPVEMTLRGGTNASMAPVIDYSILVFAPLMQQYFGIDTKFELVKRGYFPKGGGVVKVHTQPIQGALKAINVTARGKITKITGIAHVTYRLPVHIAERMAQTAKKLLHKEYKDADIDIKSVCIDESEAPFGDGVSLILLAHTSTGCILASSGLGERAVPAEDVASNCANQLIANVDAGGCIDEYFQDQLIIYMALASGVSTIKTGPLTLHTRTCLFWAQVFTGCKINVVPARGNTSLHTPEQSDSEETFLVQITGCGYSSRFKPAAQ